MELKSFPSTLLSESGLVLRTSIVKMKMLSKDRKETGFVNNILASQNCEISQNYKRNS